mgnify:CR=1 FL=1
MIVEDLGGLGSSPLARGLPIGDSLDLRHERIIPARAGFTSWGESGRPNGSDHPRSRGVYVVSCGAAAWMMGSSPLARGLLGAGLEEGLLERIIPARAGFTWPRPAAATTGEDHPRSRGVYTGAAGTDMGRTGSSPLARGLHELPPSADGGGGIIPARAGFTAARFTRWRRARDHPRSRGVYAMAGS